MKLCNFYFSVLIIALLCVNSTCFGQILHETAIANDRSHAFFQLKGSVKSVIIETYDVDEAETTGQSSSQVQEYKHLLGFEFNPQSVYQYHFRNDGKLIEWSFGNKDKTEPLYRIKKIYKQVESEKFWGLIREVTEFVDSEIWERDGLLFHQTKYEYNNQKHPISSITVDSDNEVYNNGKFSYDEKDQLIKTSQSIPDKFEFSVEQFHYDDEGRICTYEWRADAIFINLDMRVDYQYDQYNNLTRLDIIGFDDKLSLTFDNTLDHHKNWIRRTVYINDIPAYVQKKEITYYQ